MCTRLINGSIARSSGFKFSLAKTKVMYFFRTNPGRSLKLNDEPIECVSEHKYLGVIKDKNLKHQTKHADYISIVKMVRRRMTAIKVHSVLSGVSANIFLMVQRVCILPVIEYGSVVQSFNSLHIFVGFFFPPYERNESLVSSS